MQIDRFSDGNPHYFQLVGNIGAPKRYFMALYNYVCLFKMVLGGEISDESHGINYIKIFRQ